MSSSGGPQGPDGEGGTGDRPEPEATRPPDGRGYDANQFGRARAMTVFSPVRPWYRPPGGVLSLRVVFTVGRAVTGGKSKIRQLSFIHFARWVIIRRFPDHGQPRDPVRRPLLMFESNYNGTFDQYIDAFSYILTRGMTAIWGTSYGFPGPLPVTPFKRYIRGNEFTVDHYYSAYPAATTTMIKSALALREPLRAFNLRAATLDPTHFAAEYRKLLTRAQDDL